MRHLSTDVAIIGGGPAGLAAARAATDAGASTVILERNHELGGVLLQCIHPGFGLKLYGEELTGPEYAWRWIEQMAGVACLTDTMVVSVEPLPSTVSGGRRGFRLIASSLVGMLEVEAKSLVLAMGCRERTRGAIAIPGTRPAGVMTAGAAQRLVNIHGHMPGKRIVVLGSGDIGMIMARRLTWEGAEVEGVYELMPYLQGLRRNYVQCLSDNHIALHLSHTVAEIRGQRRLCSVSVAPVDDHLCHFPASCRDIEADTLLLSVGLIPENELTRTLGVAMDPLTGGPQVDNRMATTVPGLFAAGNVVHVHDLADDVSLAGQVAGTQAARYALAGSEDGGSTAAAHERIRVLPGENVRSLVPQCLVLADALANSVELQLRVRRPMESGCVLRLRAGDATLSSKRLAYVRPGEMVSMKLGARASASLAGHEAVTVDVLAAMA